MKLVLSVVTNMRYYLAPMEGVTGYVYRNAYHKYFAPMDKYMTPFIPPNESRCMNTKERNDILPENNEGLVIVPQILTNNAKHFINTARELQTYGYTEINLNLGCPSGTVVAKRKGAGFLSELEYLRQFLDEIYNTLDINISIKTRIGRDDPEEFHEIMELYRRYPIYELTIHPRIQKDFYKHEPRIEYYCKEAVNTDIPLCYNGNIVDYQSYRDIQEQIVDTNTQAVMLGRGVIANPFLVEDIKGQADISSNSTNQKAVKQDNLGQIETGCRLQIQEDVTRIMEFLREVEQGYSASMSGDKNVLFRLKELWSYLIELFPDCKKQMKKIRKSNYLSEYHSVLLEMEQIVTGRIENPVL